MSTLVGLRVDVDTLNGTRQGVPALCRLFHTHGMRASFFFSVGPDNMGRHVRRLLRPSFLVKILRTRAASLYGWDILLRGTFWPGPDIGTKARPMIRAASDEGHEIGLHAWDHHHWQVHIDAMDHGTIRDTLRRGYDRLGDIIGKPPTCSAVPAWKCTPAVLEEKTRFPFAYNSDCRGQSLFYPVVADQPLSQPQVPVTLPTYDEVVGRDGVTGPKFNDLILSQILPDRLNVLTIHAEVEGGICRDLFERFLETARSRDIAFVPLGDLLETKSIAPGYMTTGEISGREGWLSCQTGVLK
jgi:undecaprenyl phosphate-alpha-L-ara4FN deformylase